MSTPLPLATEAFFVMEQALERARASPTYKGNPLVEDFWKLIESYRAALLRIDKLEGGVAQAIVNVEDLTRVLTPTIQLDDVPALMNCYSVLKGLLA